MRKTLTFLLFLSLTPALPPAPAVGLGARPEPNQVASEPTSTGSQKPKKKRGRRKKPTPSPTPSPTPTPRPAPPPPKPEPSPRYPAPVLDEDDPAYSPQALTGTFRLNEKDSENVQEVAARATRDLSPSAQPSIQNEIRAQLEGPEVLAIERQGQTVTVASTRASQVTFKADGNPYVERLPDGSSVSVKAKLDGGKLAVKSSGPPGREFKVVFEPLKDGRLRVTREVSNEGLKDPIVIQTTYDRIADVAHWGVYNDPTLAPNNRTTTAAASGDFIVRNGESLVATLNNDLTTERTRIGDRFTMTVRQPSRFEGAIIDGHVVEVDRSDRITGRSEMGLNFDAIRLRTGETYRFAAFIESVRTPSGENVKVDNEGSLRDESRRTAARSGIGAGLGAIIGAIAGGGQGAAIGAAVGRARASAGSVYVEGKNDVNLQGGSELTIRAYGPQ